MNTGQGAVDYVRKKGYPYWVVKGSNGKTKGEYQGDDIEESISELEDLTSNLIAGKYELTVRSSKSNYRGALTYDFEVHQYAGITNSKNNSTMDAQLLPILININTGLAEIKMMIQASQNEQDRKFKDLGKALSEVFDDADDSKKTLSPTDMLKGLKGIGDGLNGLKV